jgi:hypothetical protein
VQNRPGVIFSIPLAHHLFLLKVETGDLKLDSFVVVSLISSGRDIDVRAWDCDKFASLDVEIEIPDGPFLSSESLGNSKQYPFLLSSSLPFTVFPLHTGLVFRSKDLENTVPILEIISF